MCCLTFHCCMIYTNTYYDQCIITFNTLVKSIPKRKTRCLWKEFVEYITQPLAFNCNKNKKIPFHGGFSPGHQRLRSRFLTKQRADTDLPFQANNLYRTKENSFKLSDTPSGGVGLRPDITNLRSPCLIQSEAGLMRFLSSGKTCTLYFLRVVPLCNYFFYATPSVLTAPELNDLVLPW